MCGAGSSTLPTWSLIGWSEVESLQVKLDRTFERNFDARCSFGEAWDLTSKLSRCSIVWIRRRARGSNLRSCRAAAGTR